MTQSPAAPPKLKEPATVETLSQWALIRRRFSRHRLAVASTFILVVIYALAIFSECFAPHSSEWRELEFMYCPPQPPRISLTQGLHLYAVHRYVDPITFHKMYFEDPQDIVPLGFFVKGEPYELWGLIPMERHFFGVDLEAYAREQGATATDATAALRAAPTWYLLGADKY
ncbi:MAG: hypothetical protein IMZ65_00445, partial [Planctomycetes bacterium]|nr:hypothetical protein [Planctomycetota bacterium]